MSALNDYARIVLADQECNGYALFSQKSLVVTHYTPSSHSDVADVWVLDTNNVLGRQHALQSGSQFNSVVGVLNRRGRFNVVVCFVTRETENALARGAIPDVETSSVLLSLKILIRRLEEDRIPF